jgi:hypothetical protein
MVASLLNVDQRRQVMCLSGITLKIVAKSIWEKKHAYFSSAEANFFLIISLFASFTCTSRSPLCPYGGA